MRIFFKITLIALTITSQLQEVLAIKNNYKDYKHYTESQYDCAIQDPYEKFNRKIFAFNIVINNFLLKPATELYIKFLNSYTKNRIESFIDNISEPISTINYILQGNLESVLKSFWRLTINSTFGIGVFLI